jgi:DNA (cytosine-5)-methyltransferase 1
MDLFAGAGGLSYGLSNAGFDMRLGIEVDPHCADTLATNFPDMHVVLSDIRSVDPAKTAKDAGIDPLVLDVIVGGPPCQGFSQSNHRTRNMTNPLNLLFLEYFRFVDVLRPRAFLFENVEGLRTMDHGAVVQDILKISRKLGYFVEWKVINAEDYGVPQKRRRIIFIGTRADTYTDLESFFDTKKETKITVREAIYDLPVLENGNAIDIQNYSMDKGLSEYQKLMRQNNSNSLRNNLLTKSNDLIIKRYKCIPQGGNWADIPSPLMLNYKNTANTHRWIYHRLKWDDSSIGISNFRKNMLIHPAQDRGLSVREAARLQSFPDQYLFKGPLGAQQQQVANAVPPLVSEKLGRRLIEYLVAA